MRAKVTLALLLALFGCTKLEDVALGTVITCATVADCPSGRVCNRNRCIFPSELGSPPDLVNGKVAVAPPAGRAGTTFAVVVEATKELDGPPRVILGLDELEELTCAPTAARTWSCPYTATGAERGGHGGYVAVDVRMVDLVGQEAVKNGVGGLELDFAPPVLAAASVAPQTVALGGIIQVFFTTDEDLGPPPVLVASRALDGESGDGRHLSATQQPGTRNWVYTHLVTTGDGAGPVTFTVDLEDAVGNAAAGVLLGSVVVDPVPPTITALAAAPARLAASGTLTVTFDASEAAAAGTLSATVGGRPMTCGAFSATSPSYTCTRAMVGSEIAGGTEAVQSVVVALADGAGNRTTASTSAVFDFKAPALSSSSAGPASVPLGGTLVVSFTPDEDLGPNPVLVASRALDEPGGGTRFTPTRQPGSRSYQLTHVVTAADVPGPVTFTAELTDVVGNAATGVPVGSATIDNVVPTISAVAASPQRLGMSGTLTVTFGASEAAAAGTLAVTVGGRALTCGAYSGTGYACTRAMAGNEIAPGTEAAQSIAVSLADAAGNRASASGSAVTFDFKAPALSSGSAGPVNVPLGGTLVVSFTPDEDLGPSPVLVASRALDEPGGTRFALTRQAGTRSYQFTHVVTANDPLGAVVFTAELTDTVGNAVAGVPVGSVTIDNVVPTISAVAASPSRLGTSGTLTVTFNASEPAAAGTLSVTVGGRALTCGAYSGTGYACTRAMAGNEIAAGTEAAQPIAISLADPAGNRASASGSTVTFDFKAPALAGASAEPANVPLGGVLLVSFTPDEDLGPSPVLVASRALDEPGGTRFTPLRQVGTRNYLFTHLVTTNDVSGPVTFTAELADAVGNAATGVAVGGVTFDLVPPGISSLAIAPARLGRSGTLDVTFATDEGVAAGALSVTAGGRAMGCDPYTLATRAFHCARAMAGDEIPLGTEAVQPVVVSLADVAGNPARASGSTTFDFKPPALAAKSVSPANVPLGGTILVTFTPDEDLGPDPVVLATWTAPARLAATVPAPTRQAGTRNYQLTYPVTSSDRSGNVTFLVNLADPVGNAAAAVPLGSVAVDVDPITVTTPVVSPARVRASRTLTVTFDASEAAAAGTLSVTVGGLPMACGAYAPTSPRYTCTRTVAGTEIPAGTEAAQSVVVTLADAAGNRTTASGSTVFDFRAPDIVAGSVGLGFTPPAGSLASSASALAVGGKVSLAFTVDEQLPSVPTITTTPEALSFALVGGAGQFYVFEAQLQPGAHAQGSYTVQATLADVAGNQATRTLALPAPGLRVDTVVPAVPDVVTLSRILYERVPWGTSASAGAPVFRVTGAAGAVEPVATVVAFDGPNVATAREIGRALADANGAFGPMPLIAADRREVFLVVVDGAGNGSDADGVTAGLQGTRVRDVAWTATLQGKVAGSTAENPHRLETRARWLGALEQGASPEATLPAATRGTLAWTLAATPDWVTGKAAFDTRRGRVVVPAVGYVSEWDGEVWTSVATTGGPAEITALAYDARRAEVLVYEGKCAGGTTLWAWRGAAWEPRAQGASYAEWYYYGAPAPGVHRDAFLVYDEARGQVLLAPGSQYSHGPYVCGDMVGALDYGTYAWDGSAWTALPGTTDSSQDGRLLGYDVGRRVVVRANASGTQEWNGQSWTTISIADPEGDGNPSLASSASLSTGRDTVYDPILQRILFQSDGYVWSWSGTSWRRETASITGSLVLDTSQTRALNLAAAGMYRWTGAAWVQLTPAPDVPPAAVGAVYSTARSRMEAFDASGVGYRWAQGGWQRIPVSDPQLDGNPTALAGAAYEPTSGTVLAYGTDATTWTFDGASWTLVTPGDATRPSAPRGMVTVGGAGAVTMGGNGRMYAWQTGRWVQVATGYQSYCYGPPALMAGGAGAYFRWMRQPSDADSRIAQWTPSGGYLAVYGDAGRGYVVPIAADAAGRTHVLQRTGTLLLSGTTLLPETIDDPRGVGFPSAVSASAWDPVNAAVVVLSGPQTWQLETETRSHPGHLFRAAWPQSGLAGDDCFQPGTTCTLRSVDVSWSGVAAPTEGTSSSSGTLSLWDGLRWTQIGSATASPGLQASAQISVTDSYLVPRLAAGSSSEIDLAVVMSGTNPPSPLLRTDDVSVTVRYRLP